MLEEREARSDRSSMEKNNQRHPAPARARPVEKSPAEGCSPAGPEAVRCPDGGNRIARPRTMPGNDGGNRPAPDDTASRSGTRQRPLPPAKSCPESRPRKVWLRVASSFYKSKEAFLVCQLAGEKSPPSLDSGIGRRDGRDFSAYSACLESRRGGGGIEEGFRGEISCAALVEIAGRAGLRCYCGMQPQAGKMADRGPGMDRRLDDL